MGFFFTGFGSEINRRMERTNEMEKEDWIFIGGGILAFLVFATMAFYVLKYDLFCPVHLPVLTQG